MGSAVWVKWTGLSVGCLQNITWKAEAEDDSCVFVNYTWWLYERVCVCVFLMKAMAESYKLCVYESAMNVFAVNQIFNFVLCNYFAFIS